MATPAVDKGMQFVPGEYTIFWQSWPQFENANGEHRQVGMELELIGAHASDLNHIDPSCRVCRRVRSVLLEIADRVLAGAVLTQNILSHMVDSHSNSILCLPALGNRSAVSVSLYIYWNGTNGPSSDTDLLTAIKTYLDKCGVHQR